LLSVSCHLKQFTGLSVHETEHVTVAFPLQSPSVNIIGTIYTHIYVHTLVLDLRVKNILCQKGSMSSFPLKRYVYKLFKS